MRLLLFIAALMIVPTAAAQQTLTFGVVPQQSAAKLARLWGPILAEVSLQTGIKVQFATAPDIPEFERRLAEGVYDFAYMNPYHYTVFSEKPGYQAMVRAKDKRIHGLFVVGKQSGISDISQLQQTTIAFPAPAAFAATLLTQAELVKQEVAFTPKYVSSHDSVYRAVAKGLYPAGGGILRTLKNISPDIREQLLVLWVSDGFTPHAIASHPRISSEDTDKVISALVALDESQQGSELLSNIKLKGFVNAQNSDWDDVRDLKIDVIN